MSGPIGSLGLRTDIPSLYVKTGSASNAWATIGFTPGAFSTLALTGTISPTPDLTGTINNYSPGGIASAAVLRQGVVAGGSTLTGLNAGAQQSSGALLVFENLGPGVLTLTHQQSSTSSNQFILPGGLDMRIPSNGAFMCVYDSTSNKWRVASVGGTGSTNLSGVAKPNYGNGADGDLVLDGTSTVAGFAGLSLVPSASVYKLTRDLVANNLMVNSGVTLDCDGFRVLVLNTLTCNGKVSGNARSGSNATTTTGGAGGFITTVNFLFPGTSGANGGAPDASGGGVGGTGGAPSSTHIGALLGAVAAGASGGTLQGGGGGANNAAAAGGTVATLPTPNPVAGPHFWLLRQGIQGRNIDNNGIGCGSSGAGGRGGAGTSTGGGGGGGGSGQTSIVCARLIVGTGSIEARGGNGGNGNGNGGGGGGGAGGILLVATDTAFPLSVTLDVSGGLGGARGGNGSTTAGGNGGPGLIYRFNPQN
ncbi:MAG: hypothetical protein ABI867_15295 [Kofleriaceae bacterium]